MQQAAGALYFGETTMTPPRSFLQAMGMTKEQCDELRRRQDAALSSRLPSAKESADHYKSKGWFASSTTNQIARHKDDSNMEIAYVSYAVWSEM